MLIPVTAVSDINIAVALVGQQFVTIDDNRDVNKNNNNFNLSDDDSGDADDGDTDDGTD